MDIVWQAEDSLKEKKVESDLKDLLKTMVAFANSVAPGDTAKIFIGEKDDGTVQGVTNSDNIQKSVTKEAEKIYPEIYYSTEVYERESKQCVRVDIKHNGLAPHFGGAAWVRKGTETIRATEEIYQQMVELRQSKTRALSQWLNKEITVLWPQGRKVGVEAKEDIYFLGFEEARLSFVGQHWATFQVLIDSDYSERSEPMENLILSWDDERKRLKVLIATP